MILGNIYISKISKSSKVSIMIQILTNLVTFALFSSIKVLYVYFTCQSVEFAINLLPFYFINILSVALVVLFVLHPCVWSDFKVQ